MGVRGNSPGALGSSLGFPGCWGEGIVPEAERICDIWGRLL